MRGQQDMSLTTATEVFWKIRNAWKLPFGHPTLAGIPNYTTEKALNLLNQARSMLGPHHPVSPRIDHLVIEIVFGRDANTEAQKV
jgi:hypothetical protein